MIRQMLARPKKKSVREVVKDVEKKRGKTRSYGTVYRFLRSEKAKAFHIVTKPKITERGSENRLQFCEFMRDWDENDFLHYAPSDEFFVYAERKSNFQNDRIWAYKPEDIPKEDRIREKSKIPFIVLLISLSLRRHSLLASNNARNYGNYDGVTTEGSIALDNITICPLTFYAILDILFL